MVIEAHGAVRRYWIPPRAECANRRIRAGPTEHNSWRSSQCVLLRESSGRLSRKQLFSRTETVSRRDGFETRPYKGLKRDREGEKICPLGKEIMKRSISSEISLSFFGLMLRLFRRFLLLVLFRRGAFEFFDASG